MSEKLLSAALGVAVGIGSAWLHPQRTSKSRLLLAGAIGGSLGLGGAVLWNPAIRKVNQVRDARWLAKHPICYA